MIWAHPSRNTGTEFQFLCDYYLGQVDHDKLTLSDFKSSIILKSRMTVQSIKSIQTEQGDHDSVLVAEIANQIFSP